MNNNKLLCDEKATHGNAFATPRTWEYASKLIKTSIMNGNIDKDLLIPAIANIIGDAAAAQFIALPDDLSGYAMHIRKTIAKARRRKAFRKFIKYSVVLLLSAGAGLLLLKVLYTILR